MTLDTISATLRSTAAAVALTLPVAAAPAWAQGNEQSSDMQSEQSSSAQSDQGASTQSGQGSGAQADQGSNMQSAQGPGSQSDQGMSAQSGQGAGMPSGQGMMPGQSQGGQQGPALDPETLVVTVGDAEIRGADVTSFISSLPQRLQQQPPQMLLPLAMQQLVLRELILQQAQSESLAEDPDVVALVEDANRAAEEDAMVQVWLQREFAERIDDAAIQETYDTLKAQAGEDQQLPPLEQVRPQIEQRVRQQTIGQIRDDLQQDVDVVFYGPEGEPLEGTSDGDMEGQGGSTSGSPASGDSDMGSDNAGAGQSGMDSSDDNSDTSDEMSSGSTSTQDANSQNDTDSSSSD